MVNLQLDWQQAGVLAGTLMVSAVASARTRTTAAAAAYLRESSIIAALYALWQLAGSVSLLGTSGAFGRARAIERLQRDAGLPSERSVQHLIEPHALVSQLCNLYYASMHFGVLGVFLLWLFIRHRSRYGYVRTVLVVLTAVCLVISFIPVAPPRLLPDLGFVDVAARYGQSVYGLSALSVDQLAAMPSVHVGWALLVGWAVIRVSPSRWRWLALAHPAITVFVVVATGNHFWMDGIVAAALLIVSVVTVDAVRRSLGRIDDGDPDRARLRHRRQSGGNLIQPDPAGDQGAWVQ